MIFQPEPTEDRNADCRFAFTAGCFIRKQVKYEIERAAFERGLRCHITEQKGLIESTYLVWVSGKERPIQEFAAGVESYIQRLTTNP